MDTTLGLSVALTSLLLYFLPVIIAFVRGHESRWGIFLMTLFLGWTMLFWMWAIIWSVSAKGGSSNTINNIRNG